MFDRSASPSSARGHRPGPRATATCCRERRIFFTPHLRERPSGRARVAPKLARLDECDLDSQRQLAAARGHDRTAAQPRRRAVGARRDPAVGPLAVRAGDRRGAARGGLLPRAPRRGVRGDARAVQRKRAGGRADGDRSPAPDGQAAGDRRPGDRGRAHRRRAGGGPRAPLRADRARERAAAAAAEEHVRDPGERARPRRAAARAGGAGGEGDAGGRARRPSAGLPRDRGGAARGARQAAPAVARGHIADGHAVGFQGSRRDHRRLSGRAT